MSTVNPKIGRLLAGAGGVLLLVALFLPWAGTADGASQNGWELSTAVDVLYASVAGLGLVTAITGGRFGFFRPDVSTDGVTDMLAVAASIVLAWLILFDFPAGAERGVGLYLALVATVTIACGAGDFKVKSVFPALPDDRSATR